MRPNFPSCLALALNATLAAAQNPFRNVGDTLPGWSAAPSADHKAATGIKLGGSSESRALRSRIAGAGASLEAPTGENQAYSRADLLLEARPGAATGAHAALRVHQDWSRYYEEGPNPLVLRWLDYSGALLNGAVDFSLGDFRTALSPLTLAAPTPDLLMEPGLLAARRRRAMGEWFLEDGTVPLQGARLRYAAEHPAWLTSNIQALGARLRRADPEGATWRFGTDDTDRWAAAASARFAFRRWLEAGATHIRIDDQVSLGRARAATGQVGFYESNQVTAPAAAFDATPWLKNAVLRVEGEYALSTYRARKDSLHADGVGRTFKTLENIEGSALRTRLLAGYGGYGDDPSEDPFSLRLDASWLRNDPRFVNDLAQSPSFLGRRILNSKNPVTGATKGYSTLDALYNHAYDIRPVTSLNSLEGWDGGLEGGRGYAGSNNWLRSAAFKNSYASHVTTRAERRALEPRLDPHVQLLFPYGRATPNRQGLDATLSAAVLHGALRATAVLARLKEMEASDTVSATPASFSRDGFGAALELGRWLPRPAALSLGWTRDSRGAYRVALLNAGASARLLESLDLSAAWQRLASEGTASPGLLPGLVQSQWALGLTARLGPRAAFSLEAGTLTLKEPAGPGFRQVQTSASLGLGF